MKGTPRMRRAEYIRHYGPSRGDRVRLADTGLWIEVDADDIEPGDEPLFGFGKTLRSRLMQHDHATRDSEMDFVVTGVVLLDPVLGVRKTNIGIKDGRVAGIGPIGGPAWRGGDVVFGPHSYPINGFGLIATAGGVDSHVHLPTPKLVAPALCAGVTTLITAGFEEPLFGMHRMYQALENTPVNIGLQACARTARPGSTEAVIEAGAVGLKVHEDYGAYPELLDAALRAADQHDIAVCLHTDGLNETAEAADTLAAIEGRTVHAYHVEGSAGGHLPDNLMLLTDPAVIGSSTTPSLPFARWTAAEHLDMILAVHGGNPDLPDDVAAVTERVHPRTMAAEGPLHEFGAISIINSDSQGVGRMAETIRRTWQLAEAMKRWRHDGDGAHWGERGEPGGHVPSAEHDNARVLRYLAKYTLEPALVHGIADVVGSLRPGRLADVVLWRPAYFGVKPELVLKCGFEAWGCLGQGNGAVEAVEPTSYDAHWGGTGGAGATLGATFVSRSAAEAGFARATGTRRQVISVRGTRGLTRDDLAWNRASAPLRIDPVDATVYLHDRVLSSDPVDRVPLNRRYLLT